MEKYLHLNFNFVIGETKQGIDVAFEKKSTHP